MHAQTKEETIAWITEKFEKYPTESLGGPAKYFKVISITVEPCSISYRRNYYRTGWEANYFDLTEFPVERTTEVVILKDELKIYSSKGA